MSDWLADMRLPTTRPSRPDDLAPTWLAQLQAWLAEAQAARAAGAQRDGAGHGRRRRPPAARTVLLKGLDERGLVFFTNLESRKGRELAENPRAAPSFAWLALQRQVWWTARSSR